MESNLHILSLDYTYLVCPQRPIHESATGLWQTHLQWSKALIPYQVLSLNLPGSIKIIDNITRLRSTVMELNYNGIGESFHVKLVEPQLNHPVITVSINGNETFINNSRAEILKAFENVGYKGFTILADEMAKIDQDFVQRMHLVASKYNVEVMVTDFESDFAGASQKSKQHHIYVLGNTDNIHLAEIEMRVLRDSLLSCHHVQKIPLPLSLVPCLGGVDLANFSELTKDLKVNIYLPPLICNSHGLRFMAHDGNTALWLTSSSTCELLMAQKTISKLLERLTGPTPALFISKIQISKKKLELIALYQQADVLSIMYKHGCFIQMPSLEEVRNDVVVIQGLTMYSVQEAADALSSLSCSFYALDFAFLDRPALADLEYYLINCLNQKKLCTMSMSETDMHFLGRSEEVHSLLDVILRDPKNFVLNKMDHSSTFAVSMEVANDQREFLSGKKNGKLIKILNQMGPGPSIKFKPSNAQNFTVWMEVPVGSDGNIHKALDLLLRTLNLVEMELPAQLEFNIPEVFHKSIIGNGGSVIQLIMKKYNVFIKFLRKPTDSGASGNVFSMQRTNNVLIKCPRKNMKKLAPAQQEITQLAQQCCENKSLPKGVTAVYNTVKCRLLRNHYLLLIRHMGFSLRVFEDLENEFGTYIDIPKSLSKFDDGAATFTICGNESRAKQCAEKLVTLLPESMQIRVLDEQGPWDENILKHRESLLAPLRLRLDAEVLFDTTHRRFIVSSYGDVRRAAGEVCAYVKTQGFKVAGQQTFEDAFIIASSEEQSPRKRGNHLPRKKPLGAIINYHVPNEKPFLDSVMTN